MKKRISSLMTTLAEEKELEQILAILSHDLKQPLSAIAMYTRGCIRRLEANNYQKEDLIKIMQNILEQSDRVLEIINTLKSQKDPIGGKEN